MRSRFNLSKGFTLIELVMSLFILGLVTSAVIWTLPDRSTDVDKEARKLAAQLRIAADESILSGEIVGISISDNQYAFHKFRRGAWIPLKDHSALRSHTLKPGITASVGQDGATLSKSSRQASLDRIASQPNVVFYPATPNNSFKIILDDAEDSVEITGSASGYIQLARHEH